MSRLAATVAAPSQAQAIKTAAGARRAALPPLCVVRGTRKKAKTLPFSAVVDDAASAAVGGESVASAVGSVNVNGSASLAGRVGEGVATTSGGAASGGTAAAAGMVARSPRRRWSQRKRRAPVATARRAARAELRKEVRKELAQTGASARLIDGLCAEAIRAAEADGTAGAHGEGARRRWWQGRRRYPPSRPPTCPPRGATLYVCSAAYAEHSGDEIIARAQASRQAVWEASRPSGSKATPEDLFEGTSLKQPTLLDWAAAVLTWAAFGSTADYAGAFGEGALRLLRKARVHRHVQRGRFLAKVARDLSGVIWSPHRGRQGRFGGVGGGSDEGRGGGLEAPSGAGVLPRHPKRVQLVADLCRLSLSAGTCLPNRPLPG